MKAQAVVFSASNKVELREVTLSPVGDNDVVIDVEYSAISPGTERWCLTGKFHYGDSCYYTFPLVPGYQHCGRIVSTGSSVTALKEGDRVFACNSRFNEIECFNWGGHCSMSINPQEGVIPVPETVSSDVAAFLVVAQVGYNGGTRPPVNPGDVAVVIGDGLIGQFVAQTLRARGAYVIVAGKGDLNRLEYAQKYSCDLAVDTARENLKSVVTDIAPDGAQIVVEAIGIHDNITTAYDILSHNGHLVLNGFYPVSNMVDLNPMSIKEITIYNPAAYNRTRFMNTLDLIAKKKIDIQSLITHIIKPEDAPVAYEKYVLHNDVFSLGVVIDWQ